MPSLSRLPKQCPITKLLQPRDPLAQALRVPTTTSPLPQFPASGTTIAPTTVTMVVDAEEEAGDMTADLPQARTTTLDTTVAAIAPGMTRGTILDTMTGMELDLLHRPITVRDRRLKVIMEGRRLRNSQGHHPHLRRQGMRMIGKHFGDCLARSTRTITGASQKLSYEPPS